MPPKKLRLNPPKNPSQQPTPRIKFTNVNKDIAQPGITVDEEARRRQDEHVRAASRGEVFRSTETPVRMTQRGAAGRESSHVGAEPAGKFAADSKRSASIASIGDVDDQGNLTGDRIMKDGPPDINQPALPSENQKLIQDMAATKALMMQPPAVVPQQAHPAQVAPPPTVRPTYQITTAFDRVTRDPGKGNASHCG